MAEKVRSPATVVELLRRRALEQPERLAYTFLRDGEREEDALTYGELDGRARAIGAMLQSAGLSGARALLLYPPGLEYVAAFFGCLYAGVVAVPVNPPRANRNMGRLQPIVDEAQASVALTLAATVSRLEPMSAQSVGLQNLLWLSTDDLPTTLAERLHELPLSGDALAYLQYTSGSTSTPKGVMVSHDNILYNSMYIDASFAHTPDSVALTWLPHFHDMGLIYGIIQPLYGGFHCFMMSPASFVQRPARWLEAITRHRITHSGGPNFAYDLCLRKVERAAIASLDLSSWRVAFNGAEPVRAETLNQFANAFASWGFRRSSFYPAYGLAEATLKVSGGRRAGGPVCGWVNSSALEQNRVVRADENQPGARALVGSGCANLGTRVVIVNPETLALSASDEVGEIWVAGPGVAQGYWNRPEDTVRTFQAALADTGEGPFLRTGDLGFLSDGELFVSGRLKDMIVIRGLNHYPQDIELTAERSHQHLRASGCAAFTVEMSGEERLVIVQEVGVRHGLHTDEVAAAIRQAVAENHELQVYAVVLVKAGGVPKTSSGKVQRRACRHRFLEGRLDELGHSVLAGQSPHIESDAPDIDALLTAEPEAQVPQLESYFQQQLARVLNTPAAALDRRKPLAAMGLDSLTATELQHRVELDLKVDVPFVDFLQDASIAQLARRISAQMSAPAHSPTRLVAAHGAEGTYALSYGQKALWFVQQLATRSTAYNIARAVRLGEELDVDALRRAFQALTDRHPSLRTSFNLSGGEPVQQVHARVQIHFEVHEAASWSEAFLNGRLIEEAHRPFNLEQCPLLRASLFTLSPREHVLLLVVHHIVTDFWSMGVLVRELGALYTAEGKLSAAGLSPLDLQYTDYARWQAEMLTGPEGARHWDYWQQQLAGELPVLDLPTDRPRPASQTFQGAAQTIRLDAGLTGQLKALSAVHEATLYTTLLAAFQVLLHRYTGQEDILVGTPTGGRSRAELADLVGYFANPVVIRANFIGDPTFEEFLGQIRHTVLDALAHQDFPFALLVERLQADRDPSRSPLFQVMFVLQKAQVCDEGDLTLFALGEAGGRVELSGLTLESIALEQRTAQFDLTLMVAEAEGELAVSLEYSTTLFDAATITRTLGHFKTLLEGIVANPKQRLCHLPLLTAAERQLTCKEWNNTATAYQQAHCIHHLFEEQAARTPEAVAVVFEDEELTYEELNRRANQLAHRLQSLEVGPERLVALCVERSTTMVVGLLGILKAGAAYVPLDPSYPQERLAFMLADARVRALVTERSLRARLPEHGTPVVLLDNLEEEERTTTRAGEPGNPVSGVRPDNLAYVIYTSGSTGKPKGVMVEHRNVSNFFTGMDHVLGDGPPCVWLAVTSISFDISVLELLWTLTRGYRVVIYDDASDARDAGPHSAGAGKKLELSLAYFASDEGEYRSDRYRLLIEGAKFADRNGFAAVWTPERHFHAFGGLYPSPSVVSAAIAALTERVGIRAGSIVLPLHHPIRVAEEWSVVDNLSGGRVGVSFASGWHPRDFVFAPANYAERKEVMSSQIEVVRRLWRGESVPFAGVGGSVAEVKILPRPIQPELPVWITAAGSPDTFRLAGEVGANLLTHLLGQSIEELTRKIAIYRAAWRQAGHEHGGGHVTLMLHTFVGEDLDTVRETVREPFSNYLESSVDLLKNSPWAFPSSVSALNQNGRARLGDLAEADRRAVLAHAFDRYFETSGLFGTPTDCRRMLNRLESVGIDEVACLIDFGVDFEAVMSGLRHLASLVERGSRSRTAADGARHSFAAQVSRHNVTHLQCTPSRAQMLCAEPESFRSLGALRKLVIGGEAFPAALAERLGEVVTGEMCNMYGPTETAIWSTTHPVTGAGAVPIGRPISNTEVFILDRWLQPVPVAIPGELFIGGDGVVRGYAGSPGATAERFIPHPFAAKPGARLYRTGDLARYLPNGEIEFLGRLDQQIKLRGFRVELGEIEATLRQHSSVLEAVVASRTDEFDDQRLIAYVVCVAEPPPTTAELRDFLSEKLPAYMLPAAFIMLDALPLTPNGKVDRRALPAPEQARRESKETYVGPRTPVEETLAAIWAEVLKLESVGIYDNFFTLGGHSLLMTQVVSRIRETFRIELPMQTFFQEPTISSLAVKIVQLHGAQKSDAEMSRLLAEVERL